MKKLIRLVMPPSSDWKKAYKNRDSTIKVHGLIEGQWKDLFTEQDLQNKALENSLQTALKQQTGKHDRTKSLKALCWFYQV